MATKTKEKPNKLEPKKGAIALCSLGSLGIILSEKPVPVEYEDGTKSEAWTGIYLLDHNVKWQFGPKKGQEELIKAGSPWSSKRPRVICYAEDILLFSKNAEMFHDLVNDLNVNADQDISYFKHKLYRGYQVPAKIVKHSPYKVLKGLVTELEGVCGVLKILPESYESYREAKEILNGGKDESQEGK